MPAAVSVDSPTITRHRAIVSKQHVLIHPAESASLFCSTFDCYAHIHNKNMLTDIGED